MYLAHHELEVFNSLYVLGCVLVVEKATPVGINLMRSQVLCRASQKSLCHVCRLVLQPSPVIPSPHLSSQALTSHPKPSPLIPSSHLSSPALTSHLKPLPLIPSPHLSSPALTSHPKPSLLIPNAPPKADKSLLVDSNQRCQSINQESYLLHLS